MHKTFIGPKLGVSTNIYAPYPEFLIVKQSSRSVATQMCPPEMR